MKRKVYVVSFGLAGHSEQGTEESTLARDGLQEYTLSGYDSPENWSPDPGTDYSEARLIDKRAVLEAHPRYCVDSPLCGVKLSEAEIDRCPTPSPIFAEAMLRGGNEFGGLLVLQASHKIASEEPGPLDSVSPSMYAAWWKAHGARMGRVVAVVAQWGTV